MPLGLRSHLNPEGERKKDVKLGEGTRAPIISQAYTHCLALPVTITPVCMYLGSWALGGQTNPMGFIRILAEIYFHRGRLLFVPEGRWNSYFTHSSILASSRPPPTLALLPSKILTSFSELLILPPISIVVGGLCLFAPQSCLCSWSAPWEEKGKPKRISKCPCLLSFLFKTSCLINKIYFKTASGTTEAK